MASKEIDSCKAFQHFSCRLQKLLLQSDFPRVGYRFRNVDSASRIKQRRLTTNFCSGTNPENERFYLKLTDR
jgi:hypothetical protein